MLQLLQRYAAKLSASLRYMLNKDESGRWSEVRTHSGLGHSLAYRLYIPASAERQTLPLVVMLHGCQQDAQSFAGGTRMNELADRHGFMALYPEQSRAANPLRCWNWFSARVKVGRDEQAMIARLVQNVCDTHAVDRKRVYVVGMSAGAAMARLLCVHQPRLFAAAVLHSGVMYRAATSAVDALNAMRRGSHASPETTAREAVLAMGTELRIVPTLLIHGDRDDVVSPDNLSLHVAQFMALAQLCDQPLIAAAETLVQQDEGAYRQQDFSCHGQLVLRRCMIEGLAHAWSGGDAQYPYHSAAGPNASEMAWAFMREFRQGVSAETFVTRSWPGRLRRWLRPRPRQQTS